MSKVYVIYEDTSDSDIAIQNRFLKTFVDKSKAVAYLDGLHQQITDYEDAFNDRVARVHELSAQWLRDAGFVERGFSAREISSHSSLIYFCDQILSNPRYVRDRWCDSVIGDLARVKSVFVVDLPLPTFPPKVDTIELANIEDYHIIALEVETP